MKAGFGVFVVGIGLVLGVLLLVRCLDGSQPASPGVDQDSSTSMRGEPGRDTATSDSIEVLGVRALGEPGTGRHAAKITRTVLDTRGHPIELAEVSWTTLGSRVPDLARDWPHGDQTAWSAATTATVTDEKGRFSLSPPPGSNSEPSVVWITHVGHRVKSWLVDSSGGVGSLPLTFALEPADSVQVRVVTSDGHPAPDALITQRRHLGVRERNALSREELESSFALRRQYTLSAAGRASVADLDGRMCLSAQQGDEKSPGWLGTAPDSIELRLGPSFTWSAVVRSETPDLAVAAGRIDVVASSGSRREFVDSATVETLGRIAPREAAWVAGDHYTFELVGAGIPHSVEVEAPGPGTQIEVEFKVFGGVRFPVRVADPAGTALAGANVQWAWNRDGRWQYATRRTDALGIAVLEHSPTGMVWLTIDRAGFVGYRRNLELTGSFEGNFDVVLQPGASLSGVVRHSGAPVQEFSIHYRQASIAASTRTADFTDRKDGTFTLEGLPLEEIAVFAVSPKLPRSRGQLVDMRVANSKPLEFDLVAGGVARGAVRDARSSEPLAGAEIQLWTSEGGMCIRPFGALEKSAQDGRFRIQGLALGEPTAIEVRYPRRASAWIHRRAESDQEIDLGTIALQEPGSMQVELKMPDESNLESWFAELADEPQIAPQRFSPLGIARFDDLVPGGYFVNVRSNAPSSHSASAMVEAGARTRVVLDLSVGRPLEVEIVRDTDTADISDVSLTVQMFMHAFAPPQFRFAPLPAHGTVRFESVVGEHVRVSLNQADGTCLGCVTPTPEELAVGRVVLRIGGAARVVRVIDAKGKPLAGVLVSLGSPSTGWLTGRTTDSDGRVSWGALGAGEYCVSMQVAPRGGGVLRRVVLNDEPVDVVFAPDAELAFRVLDRDEPLAGVPIQVLDGFGLEGYFSPISTDDQGWGRNQGYIAQPFTCRVRQAALWPTDFIVTAAEAGSQITAQVRRRGSVVLHAKRGGLALRGAALRVESEEFATSIEPWIRDGRVTASDVRGVTDEQGRLRLDALPRGPYRWSVTLDDGATISGRFEVEPQRRVDVDVLVP